MGLLDLPAPLFAGVTSLFAGFLPPVALILLWAVLGAAVAVELYRVLSPQQRLAAVKSELSAVQRRLAAYDGDLDDAWPMIRRMFGLALRRLAIVLPAAILSSLPLLSLIVWLDTAYARKLPAPGETISVTTPTAGADVRWRSAGAGEAPHVVVTDPSGRTVADVAVKAPVDRIEKRQWWNILFANPLGYLPADAAVERVDLSLEKRELIAIGPPWLRGWEPLFFAALLLCAIPFSLLRRVQ
ncbi:MAG TPA: hypothetical protein VH835_16355 [Dongiaceae bacterium]|jgi:hypothetical protein